MFGVVVLWYTYRWILYMGLGCLMPGLVPGGKCIFSKDYINPTHLIYIFHYLHVHYMYMYMHLQRLTVKSK